ncbi:beta-lactamase-like protein [Xylaria telfairii]|nr:beta-lactamase-like protein [Xylaria telfairii]
MKTVDIPPSRATVSVSIIDTGSWAYNVPYENFFSPLLDGLDTFDFCSYVFLVTHHGTDGERRVLFDLGMRKDCEELFPIAIQTIKNLGYDMEMEKDTADILVEHGGKLSEIEAIVWSHLHWGHTGNPSRFPNSVKVLVGPGVIEASMLGWPKAATAEFNETDIANREVVEISEDQFTVEIGGLPAYDYFGDGSFYVLSAPGHSVGHLNALARIGSEPESYILMAADSVQLGDEFRPSAAVPLPGAVDEPGISPWPCPKETLLKLHPESSATSPFFGLDPCFPYDLQKARETVKRIQAFDADNRVLVVFAHDIEIYNTPECYQKLANNWYSKGWKLASRWKFLVDIQMAMKRYQARSTSRA